MLPETPVKPKEFTTDISSFDKTNRSMNLSTSAKNLHLLANLNIENLWLTGIKDIDLNGILSYCNPAHLRLYEIRLDELVVLEKATNAKSIELNWSNKATKLWDISKNKNLESLSITDFSKLYELDDLTSATQIKALTLHGGFGATKKAASLAPLASLQNLLYLEIGNLDVSDGSLKPLADLKNLKELKITQQFETKEFAWLSSRLPNTRCTAFNPYITCDIRNPDNSAKWDVMITGKRKPFLLSTKDSKKIEKYVLEFERLKKELSSSEF